jgi:hypothetical protein
MSDLHPLSNEELVHSHKKMSEEELERLDPLQNYELRRKRKVNYRRMEDEEEEDSDEEEEGDGEGWVGGEYEETEFSVGLKRGESSIDVDEIEDYNKKKRVQRNDMKKWRDADPYLQEAKDAEEWMTEEILRRKVLEKNKDYQFMELVAGASNTRVDRLYNQDDLTTAMRREKFLLSQQQSKLGNLRLTTAEIRKQSDSTQKSLNKLKREEEALESLKEIVVSNHEKLYNKIGDPGTTNSRPMSEKMYLLVNMRNYYRLKPLIPPAGVLVVFLSGYDREAIASAKFILDHSKGNDFFRSAIFEAQREAQRDPTGVYEKRKELIRLLLRYWVDLFLNVKNQPDATYDALMIQIAAAAHQITVDMTGYADSVPDGGNVATYGAIHAIGKTIVFLSDNGFLDKAPGYANLTSALAVIKGAIDGGAIADAQWYGQVMTYYRSIGGFNTDEISKSADIRSFYGQRLKPTLKQYPDIFSDADLNNNREKPKNYAQYVLPDRMKKERGDIEPLLIALKRAWLALVMEQVQLGTRIKNYEESLKKLDQRLSDILDGTITMEDVDYPYRHGSEWLLRPEHSGDIKLLPIVVQAIEQAYNSLIDNANVSSGIPYEYFQHDEVVRSDFAELVANQEAMAAVRFPNQYYNANKTNQLVLEKVNIINRFKNNYEIRRVIDEFGLGSYRTFRLSHEERKVRRNAKR